MIGYNMSEWFIYRLTSSGGAPIGKQHQINRGVCGLISPEHEELRAFIDRVGSKQTLYISVGVGEKRFVSNDCVYDTRVYSAMHNVSVPLVKRMLSIRTNWSKK